MKRLQILHFDIFVASIKNIKFNGSRKSQIWSVQNYYHSIKFKKLFYCISINESQYDSFDRTKKTLCRDESCTASESASRTRWSPRK